MSAYAAILSFSPRASHADQENPEIESRSELAEEL